VSALIPMSLKRDFKPAQGRYISAQKERTNCELHSMQFNHKLFNRK